MIDDLIKQAVLALENSYAPYSNFKVSCVIETDQNDTHQGVNVENASYGLTICAERAAIASMISNKPGKIKNVIVLSKAAIKTPPCGACRQVISEFATKDCQVVLAFGEKYNERLSLSFAELLPHNFCL